MAPHTPSPWLVDGIDTERGTFEIWSSRADPAAERLLCSNDGLLNEVEPEESIANAYLIAASPDLLEACKLLVADPNGLTATGLAMVAISKAEGETK